MAAPARKAVRGGVRRPFAPVVVPPSPSPYLSGNQVAREDAVDAVGAASSSSFARRVRRFGKCSWETEAAFLGVGGKAAKKCGGAPSPVPASVSRKPVEAAAARATRTAIGRRMMGSCSKKCSTPAAAAAAAAAKAKPAYDAPRVPVWDFSEEPDGKVRATLSSPYDVADQGSQEPSGGEVSSRKRTMRSVAMKEAMAGLPEPGEGRVKYLVYTFERLLSLAGGGPEARSRGARRRKDEATATPRTTTASSPTPPGPVEIDVSYSSVASSSEVSFPAIAGVACILDASDRTSRIKAARDQRRQRRCNSTGSSERGWSRKMTSVTSQRPFNLRTEQRGKAKEDNFAQRIREMQLEEERLRNLLAQGLPFTTDEPENPAKLPMKEPTEPIDLVLHSEVRAVGRAKFDHQVAERNSFLEEVKLAKERQQKVDEEIEIKQLRKEQVPRAHPMPDFTRPFVSKRSVKPQTIPRKPRFHPRLMRNISKT